MASNYDNKAARLMVKNLRTHDDSGTLGAMAINWADDWLRTHQQHGAAKALTMLTPFAKACADTMESQTRHLIKRDDYDHQSAIDELKSHAKQRYHVDETKSIIEKLFNTIKSYM